MIAPALSKELGVSTSFDNLKIELDRSVAEPVLEGALESLRRNPPQAFPSIQIDNAIEGLKFSTCIPASLARTMIEIRLADPNGVSEVLRRPLQVLG
jgi:ATP-dependent Lhr-like helicase